MKNRKLLLIVSLVLALTMSLGGTLAYLTDTDEAVNVMTLGNVDIEQLENGKAEGGFVQPTDLYPAYYTDDYVEDMEVVGAVDKKVTVKNVGSSEAFVRTVFAFEAGSLSADEYQTMIHLDTAANLVWTGESVTIGEEKFYLAYHVYPDAVKPGAETGATLERIVMDKEAGNELVASFNGDYKVYVVSQAVQVTNLKELGAEKALEAAFGAISAANNPWTGEDAIQPTKNVTNSQELAQAIADGATTIVLEDNTYNLPNLAGKSVHLIGKSKDVVINCDGDQGSHVVDLKFSNVTIQGTNENYLGVKHSNTVTYDNCVIKDSLTLYANKVVFTDCEFNQTGRYIWTYGVPEAVFQDCIFNNADSRAILVYTDQSSDTKVSNVTIDGCTFIAAKKGYTGSGDWTAAVEIDSTYAPAKVTVTNSSVDNNHNGMIRIKKQIKPVKTEENGNTATVKVSNTAELEAAIAAGTEEIILANGNYVMPEPDLRGKKLTLIGDKKAVLDVTAVDARDQFVTGATLEFDGVTLNFGNVNYMGFANTASLTYKDCAINGLQFLYGQKVAFENCDLNSNGAEHCVWTYGVQNVSFTDCDFTYGDRGINCYSDNDVTGGKQTVNFKNCTFATENTASKGAVEINSQYFSVGIEVNLEGCTAPAHGELAYVSPWDQSNGAKTTINIK